MGLRRGIVLSDEEEGEASAPPLERSKRQDATKTDSIHTQPSLCQLDAKTGNTSRHKRLKKSGNFVNPEQGFPLNEIGADGNEHRVPSDVPSRKNKGETRVPKVGTRLPRNCKREKRSASKGHHKFGSKFDSDQHQEAPVKSTWNQSNEVIEKQLEEEIEPSILEDKYMTAKDNHVKATDIAERLQVLEESIGPFQVNEQRLKEANWIYDRAFGHLAVETRETFRSITEIDKSDIVLEIEFLLTQLHDKKLEIPFVAMYRKEDCTRLLHKRDSTTSLPCNEGVDGLNQYEAFWKIFSWDRRWHLLQRRKAALQEAYVKRANIQSHKELSTCVMLDRVVRALQEAESEEDVEDADAMFNLYFPPEEVKVFEGQYKRPKRQSCYSICCDSGLGDLARQFGITPKQFGENLQSVDKIHEVFDPPAAPEDIAIRYCTRQWSDPHSALKGARHMASSEISSEPAIRKHVRSFFLENAVINTKPTEKGEITIDKSHRFSSVKWVQARPLSKIHEREWILIQKAVEEEILEVTVGLTQEVIDGSLMPKFQAHYLSVGSSRVAELWNDQRKEVLKNAVLKMLIPSIEKETRILLIAKAKAWVQWEYATELWKKVSIAPYPHPKLKSDGKTVDDSAPRVLACCWGPRNSPTTFVMLDSCGEILGTLQTGYLNLHIGSSEDIQRKTNDQLRLQKFIVQHQPHVLVLGATNLACRHLKDMILENISKVVEDHPYSLAEGLDAITVVYGEESLPLLYEKSQVSMEQLPGQPSIVRRAVALGRYLQNPLAMVASLCSSRREIVALNLHSMQSFLTADEVYDAVERVMITVTNQVGVDINLAAAHEWLFSPLQFVSGLGPRKASMIQKIIQGAGGILSRNEMLRPPFSIKQNVFANCCGFLRIRGVGYVVSRCKGMNPLDNTRIHPESYELAKKLAVSVYCTDHVEVDDEIIVKATQHIRKSPESLMNLSLEAFPIEGMMGEVKFETLKDIRMELLDGFQEWRAQYVQPTQDEEFTWLTGEDEESLAMGRIVNVTARKVYHNRVMCVLESGIWGMLQKNEFTDEASIDLSKVVFEGSILACRVANILKEKFLVELTCRENYIEPENWQSIDHNVEVFVQKVSPLDDKHYKEDVKVQHFKPRRITHPLFQNISTIDAIKALSDTETGEVIFHPSSKGPTCLSMTLKFHDNVYVHKEIVEHEKDIRDLASFLQLGKTLKIDGKPFQSLDEVITYYVTPLISNLKEVLGSKQFQSGGNTEINNYLFQDTNLSSNSIVYCFSLCHQHPGAIVVSYLRNKDVHSENIDLYPEGYKFRGRMFNNIEKLAKYFSVTVAQDNLVSIGSEEKGGQYRSSGKFGRGSQEFEGTKGCENFRGRCQEADGAGMRGRGGRYGSKGRRDGSVRRDQGFEGARGCEDFGREWQEPSGWGVRARGDGFRREGQNSEGQGGWDDSGVIGRGEKDDDKGRDADNGWVNSQNDTIGTGWGSHEGSVRGRSADLDDPNWSASKREDREVQRGCWEEREPSKVSGWVGSDGLLGKYRDKGGSDAKNCWRQTQREKNPRSTQNGSSGGNIGWSKGCKDDGYLVKEKIGEGIESGAGDQWGSIVSSDDRADAAGWSLPKDDHDDKAGWRNDFGSDEGRVPVQRDHNLLGNSTDVRSAEICREKTPDNGGGYDLWCAQKDISAGNGSGWSLQNNDHGEDGLWGEKSGSEGRMGDGLLGKAPHGKGERSSEFCRTQAKNDSGDDSNWCTQKQLPRGSSAGMINNEPVQQKNVEKVVGASVGDQWGSAVVSVDGVNGNDINAEWGTHCGSSQGRGGRGGRDAGGSWAQSQKHGNDGDTGWDLTEEDSNVKTGWGEQCGSTRGMLGNEYFRGDRGGRDGGGSWAQTQKDAGWDSMKQDSNIKVGWGEHCGSSPARCGDVLGNVHFRGGRGARDAGDSWARTEKGGSDGDAGWDLIKEDSDAKAGWEGHCGSSAGRGNGVFGNEYFGDDRGGRYTGGSWGQCQKDFKDDNTQKISRGEDQWSRGRVENDPAGAGSQWGSGANSDDRATRCSSWNISKEEDDASGGWRERGGFSRASGRGGGRGRGRGSSAWSTSKEDHDANEGWRGRGGFSRSRGRGRAGRHGREGRGFGVRWKQNRTDDGDADPWDTTKEAPRGDNEWSRVRVNDEPPVQRNFGSTLGSGASSAWGSAVSSDKGLADPGWSSAKQGFAVNGGWGENDGGSDKGYKTGDLVSEAGTGGWE